MRGDRGDYLLLLLKRGCLSELDPDLSKVLISDVICLRFLVTLGAFLDQVFVLVRNLLSLALDSLGL